MMSSGSRIESATRYLFCCDVYVWKIVYPTYDVFTIMRASSRKILTHTHTNGTVRARESERERSCFCA
jgi:hypothetical protein